MKVVRIILVVINSLLLIHSIHFGFFALFPFIKKAVKREKISNKKHVFRIIIAARNEEKVLKPLIRSIEKQKYDKDKYEIYVIPNNCTDNTKQIAIDMKCKVLEPNFSPKSKGEVLNYVFDKFKKNNDFDTYLIMDADNVLDSNFLEEINNKLNEGYKVVQGFRDTKNLYQNYITESYALFFYLQSLFLYEARIRMGESSTINGTGYAVLKEFIDDTSFRAKTVTEDIELTCVAALNREKVGYSRDAIFYDEQVTSFSVSMKQRKRWIQGLMQVWKTKHKELFKKIKEKNTFQLTDQFFALTLPIDQALVFVFLIVSYFLIIPYYMIIIGILVGYIGEIIVSIFLTLYFKKDLKKLLPGILFFPIFHISWLPIYIYSLFNTNNTWEEIKHNESLEIEEIIGE